MATSGSPWIVKKKDIIQALKDKKGRLTHVAKHFHVDYKTIQRKINADSELAQLVSDLRNDFEATIIDLAENCVAATMASMKDEPGLALKAAMYTLNSRGQKHGWNNTFLDQSNLVTKCELENKDIEIQALKAKIDELTSKQQASS